jgi:hypothetical protein
MGREPTGSEFADRRTKQIFAIDMERSVHFQAELYKIAISIESANRPQSVED